MASQSLLDGLPTAAPAAPRSRCRFADVAVTATAKEFSGIYRGKQYHAPDFDAVLDRALEVGVEKVMLTGMSLPDVQFNLEIARRRPEQCKITIGVHPYHAAEADEGGEEYFQKLGLSVTKLLDDEPDRIAAFGELGLDYDYLAHAPKEAQIRTFKRQLDMIVEAQWNVPLFLHCRAAFDDFVSILAPYLSRLALPLGLVHSFVGTAEQMRKLTELGLEISVNSFSFRDPDSLQMVRQAPLDKLQIETDAPWGEIQASSEISRTYLKNASAWTWGSKKKDKFELGKMIKERNESCAMERVALIVAGLKELSVDEVAEQAWTNSIEMFFKKR
ncbi:Mg-dependent DNase [Aaosphaeria arxii CBS 175.79]|uniref:Mg-dependent DNase n=1 Tax=Aaosphaeria arxii CBS 175.79 TaxID=1450172 RepID=A0A6A5X764_9PLEO|nr:Mg-dependent DNase [Aaosphaeria arxii CBS 175.79]KAF2008760.1 Mg-dependent DNase [Aaosphaeria arxii CBS 175.79]